MNRIDEEIEKQSLLKHPFYVMWSEGKLTAESLAGYSREYFQLVKAVPGLVSNIATLAAPSQEGQIRENLAEEMEHIEPWIRFAGSLGVSRAEIESHRAGPLTMKSVEDLNALTTSSFEEGVAAMYAYEKQLPQISRSKIEGLTRRYGMKAGDATKYFELHEEADVRHAAVWAAFLARSTASEDSILRAVRDSLKAQNAILDSVMASYC